MGLNLQINTLTDNLGIDDVVQQQFNIFPNPVNDVLSINTQIDNYKYTLFTLQGQLLLESKNNSGNTTIDYSEFAEGVYLLNVETDSGSHSFKIIKK